MNFKKSLSVFVILLLILNMVLFAFKMISLTLFWTVIIVFGVLTYSGYFRKK
ncbi:hypothetical protein JXB27_02400 [Candidatus Woesearchaeota archaeon]|nr:hypothetical protein [Candidatus Woesearchaeota archaeon]